MALNQALAGGLRMRLRLRRSGRGGGNLAGAPPRSRQFSTSASVVLGLPYRLSPIEGAGPVLFSQTPSALVALKPSRSIIAVYGWLDLRANKRGFWFDSQQAIADAVGVSRPTVERAIRFLRAHGFIETERQHHATDILKYTVTRHHRRGQPPSEMMAAPITGDGSKLDLSSYRDHRSQQQTPTPEVSPSSRMNHGAYQFIFDRQLQEQKRRS